MRLPHLIAGTAAVLIAGASVASAQEVIVESPAVVEAYPAPTYVYPETYAYPDTYGYYEGGPYAGQIIIRRPSAGTRTPDSGDAIVRPSETWRSRPGDSAS